MRLASAPVRHRRFLLGGSMLVVLSSAATLAFATHRIESEQAAFSAPSAGRCVPTTLNRSALLPGTPLAVNPLPDSYDALPRTQISMLGLPAGALSRIVVTGSSTGRHTGALRAYSQADGASFLPAAPFRSGETVTVQGTLQSAGHSQPFSYHFVVARPDILPHPPSLHPSRYPNQKLHFRTRRDLEPPLMVVTARSSESAPGYIFTAPYNGSGQAGPMIFDEAGNLVWFSPVPAEDGTSNLQVQQLGGKPVLTYWQGYIPPQGYGQGEEVILDSAYHQIGRVHAGNGYKADLHDFHLTPQSTVVLTAFEPIACDLSSLGGPRGGAVTDTLYQELDLHTGLVRREWHSVDHIALGDSYSTAVTTSTTWPFDYFHINSVDQHDGGTTLISARNTWALYELNTVSGQVLSTIGGKHSTVALPSGTRTAFQHDAKMLPDGSISIFDNGAVPKVHPQSRGLIETINPGARTATLVAQYEHPKALSSGSQGNVQPLPNGNLFVGWGSQPYFSEFSPSGKLLFDAHMHGTYQAYRGYRFPWTGTSNETPAIATATTGSKATVYASWNGDTRAARWQVLAGSNTRRLAAVAAVPRTGFETAIPVPRKATFYAVQALDAAGAVIGTSHAIRG